MFYSIDTFAFLLLVGFVNQNIEPLDCPFGLRSFLQMAYFVPSEFFSEVVSKGPLGAVTGIYIKVDTLFT